MPEDAAPVEQLAQALDQDTPDAPAGTPEAPDGTPSDQPAIDYEKRYNDLRSEFDSRNQRFSQYEQFVNNLTDSETQAEALRALGLEIEEDEEDDEYADPTDALTKRLDQFENYLSSQAAEREQAEIVELEKEWLSESISRLEKSDGLTFSAKEKKALENLGHSLRDDDGVPDYEAAYKLFSEASDASRERYLKSKTAAKVELGSAGEEKIDMANDDARTQFLADMLEAGEQS